ncbi:hypothetical protein ABEG63_04665 [Chryseobacterium sp. C39-AII1]|uniref:hypothetical protein n=1 Tax=Chryseobacterium sp. C39-AII1 TaxID=3080332 RepID=UPI00320810F0
MSKETYCNGKIILTSKKNTLFHAFNGNLQFTAGEKNQWKGEQGSEIGNYEKMILPNNSAIIRLYYENIVIVASEVHDKKSVNKLMFMAQAIRRIRISSVQTVLYFTHGYSSNMIFEFEKSLRNYKKNIKIIAIKNISELINYINLGYTNNIQGDYRTIPNENGSMYKVNNLYIYSHGMPSRITFMLDWDLYKKNNNIKSSEDANGNELNLSNYTKLNPSSFSKDAEIWSFACRTGLSIDNDTEIERFTWGENESLAQKLSDRLNCKTHAFLKRSNYENTWGSQSDRIDLKIADNLEKINIHTTKEDKFREYKKSEIQIDGKYPWQPQGAYNDVKAGDFPLGPPNCMCLFQKNKDVIIPCKTMALPKG